MVCDKCNNRIQVFELNGKFVGKFGTGGSNLGEFDGPTSVTALSHGEIVASDFDNDRIKCLNENCRRQPFSKVEFICVVLGVVKSTVEL